MTELIEYKYTTFTGVTHSRLEEVASFKQGNRYAVGVSNGTGIVSVAATTGGGSLITYQIDYITYQTNTETGETTYSLSYNYQRDIAHNFINEPVVAHDALPDSYAPVQVEANLSIDRDHFTVFQQHARLCQFKTLSQIVNYAGNLNIVKG